MLTLKTIMSHELLENKSVCEISNRGFKEGLAKVHETSNKTDLGGLGVGAWLGQTVLLGKVQSFLQGARTQKKVETQKFLPLCPRNRERQGFCYSFWSVGGDGGPLHCHSFSFS